jgi:long chain fatty acid CoA FadD26
MTSASLPALLWERASQQPDQTAYTFIDFEVDPAGFAEPDLARCTTGRLS